MKLTGIHRFPKFITLSHASIQQAIEDPNCLGGATYFGPGLTFWTTTIWLDEKSMKNYVRNGGHQTALPWLARICSEAATGHLTIEKVDSATQRNFTFD